MLSRLNCLDHVLYVDINHISYDPGPGSVLDPAALPWTHVWAWALDNMIYVDINCITSASLDSMVYVNIPMIPPLFT